MKIKKFDVFISLIVAVVFISSGTLSAALIETTISTAVGDGADVHIRAGDYAGFNWGDDDHVRSSGDNYEQAIVRFDLAELDGLVVTEASFSAYITDNSAYTERSAICRLFGIDLESDSAQRPGDGGWDEMAITWNDSHGFDEGSHSYPHGPNLTATGAEGLWAGTGWQTTNPSERLVDYLNEALEGPQVATILLVHDRWTRAGDQMHEFRSKEYGDGEYAPYLNITAIPEPSTLSLLGLVGLLLMKRRYL